MTNPRILTHKSQRKLTNSQVRSLLTEYVETDTTYKALAERYGIAVHTVSQIVRGLSYRELSSIADLRKRAQEKAATRFARYSNAQAMRVPDPAQTVVEVDFNSVESIDAAILRLQAVRSLLIGPSGETASAEIGGVTDKRKVKTEEVPFPVDDDDAMSFNTEEQVPYS